MASGPPGSGTFDPGAGEVSEPVGAAVSGAATEKLTNGRSPSSFPARSTAWTVIPYDPGARVGGVNDHPVVVAPGELTVVGSHENVAPKVPSGCSQVPAWL